MVLTKRQKTMVVVLGVGLAALAVDRFVLGGPESGPSQAQAASPDPGMGPSPLGAPAAPAETDLLANSLATRLDTLRETMDLDLSATKDAFCPSESWLSDMRPADPVATSSTEVKGLDFGRKHQLNAVVTGGGGHGGAFIGDRFVRVGQVIDGFRLVKIGYRTATLENDGVEVVLKLKDPEQDR